MQEAKPIKAWFYVDESGDPTILAKGGKNLLSEGKSSRTFMIGHVESEAPKDLSKSLSQLRDSLMNDEYLKEIPSISSLRTGFHANKDCAEVKEKVFRILRDAPFQAFVIVARKDEHLFRKKFDLRDSRLYEYLVSKLFENRLHLYSEIDIYFSSRGNTVREDNMHGAIETARATFGKKWGKEHDNRIRVFIQEASQHPMLQVADYTLWTVNRAFERGDFRYYNFLKDRISLVHDVFDNQHYPKTYYTPRNPLTIEKISPAGG